MRCYFENIGIVAAVQKGIEEHFGLLWNELEKKPYDIGFTTNVWRVMVERELGLYESWPYELENDIEDIDIYKFSYGSEEHYHTFRCGYGQRSGQFVFGDITSVYGHIPIKKHHDPS